MRRTVVSTVSILACAVSFIILINRCGIKPPEEAVIRLVNEFNQSSQGRYSVEVSDEYHEITIQDHHGVVDTAIYRSFLMELTRASRQRYLINVLDSAGMLDHVQYAGNTGQGTTYHLIDHYE